MRTIAVGDVHGCLEELDELLRLVEPNGSRLVFLGDLLDRGPDSVGVVRRVRELGAECVLGNHEESHLRWRRHEAARASTGKPNPMRPISAHKLAIQAGLSEDDWRFLGHLPASVRLGPSLSAVHAGCQPGIQVESQRESVLTRMRYLRRSDGKMLALDHPLLPSEAAFWTEAWTGPDSIVYGHHPADKERPGIDEPVPGVKCYGIDTGCCFGGKLTAVVFDGGKIEFMSVKARRTYVERA